MARKTKLPVWVMFRDTQHGREFYIGRGWPHLPEAWSTDPQDARVYFESAAAYSAREWVSANSYGASIEVTSTARVI